MILVNKRTTRWRNCLMIDRPTSIMYLVNPCYTHIVWVWYNSYLVLKLSNNHRLYSCLYVWRAVVWCTCCTTGKYALDDNVCTTCVGDHVCKSYMRENVMGHWPWFGFCWCWNNVIGWKETARNRASPSTIFSHFSFYLAAWSCNYLPLTVHDYYRLVA